MGFFIFSNKVSTSKRILSTIITFFAAVSLVLSPIAAQARAIINLPATGTMVLPSATFSPAVLKGITINPTKPFNFDFIFDAGEAGFTKNLEPQVQKLIEHFLVSLATPEDQMWVNLSPYEQQRIMQDNLSQTNLGRQLLMQDYLLKQLTSSLLHPETKTGKAFWAGIYEKAQNEYGTTDVPVDTFHKVWIVPNKSSLYVHENTAFIIESSLKVLLEDDYKNYIDSGLISNKDSLITDHGSLSTELMKNLILPAIEKEINTGKTFAPIRQVYNSIILASWYRDNLKESILTQVYADQNKVDVLATQSKEVRQDIHAKYMQAFQKGVFNFVKEEMDAFSGEELPRKYFSGGSHLKVDPAMYTAKDQLPATANFDTEAAGRANVTFDMAETVETNKIPNAIWNQALLVVYTQQSPALGNFKTEFEKLEDMIDDFDSTRTMQATNIIEMVAPSALADAAQSVEADAAMFVPSEAEKETGLKYWKGELKTASIDFPFEGLENDDVTDIPTLPKDSQEKLEKIGIQSISDGEGAIGFLAAGASSRMGPKYATPEARELLAGVEIESKGAVPIGRYEGQVVNYFDAFGVGVSRYLEAVSSAFPTETNTEKNIVFYMTNDAYSKEQAGIIAKNENYGLPMEVISFKQALGAKYFATPADVKKYFDAKRPSKFKSDEEESAFNEAYRIALEKAKEVEEEFKKGNKDALVAPNEPDPLGHGEFFHQLVSTKTILKMQKNGTKWVTAKNVDNYSATFDPTFSQILGYFLENDLDAVFEMSPRSPGQKGGSGIKHENGHAVGEDPFLKATLGENGKPVLDPLASKWINNATGIFSLRFIIASYKKDGQSDEDFYKELDAASEAEAEAIAQRGRDKFSKIFDVKPAKTKENKGFLTSKPETNMWSSSLVVDPTKYKMEIVGVRGASNFDIDRYLDGMTPAEKQQALADLRFLATKQWDVDDADKGKKRAQLEEQRGSSVSDEAFQLVLESYAGNKLLAEDILKYIFTADPVTPGLFGVEDVVKDKIRELSDPGPEATIAGLEQKVADIKSETSGGRASSLTSQLSEDLDSLNKSLRAAGVLTDRQSIAFSNTDNRIVLIDPEKPGILEEKTENFAISSNVTTLIKKFDAKRFRPISDLISNIVAQFDAVATFDDKIVDRLHEHLDLLNTGLKNNKLITTSQGVVFSKKTRSIYLSDNPEAEGGDVNAQGWMVSNNVQELVKRLDEQRLEEIKNLISNVRAEFDGVGIKQKTLEKLNSALEALTKDLQDSKIIDTNKRVAYRSKGNQVILVDAATKAKGLEAIIPQQRQGGIDFNRQNLNLETQGGDIKIEIDPAILAEIQANGVPNLVPRINSITPLPSVLPLLGLAPRRDEKELAKS